MWICSYGYVVGSHQDTWQVLLLPVLNVLCSEQVFGHHVTRWINGSKAGLCARCRQIESTTMASAVHPDRITEDGA